MSERRLDLCLNLDGELWANRRDPQVVHDVGGKALGLSSLVATELPTPTALVLPTSAYWNFIDAMPLRELLQGELTEVTLQTIRRSFETADLPKYVALSLNHDIRDLQSPLAFRSSAVMEDAAEASWAGQFTSVLGVNHKAGARSVLRCWASLFSSHAANYARSNGFDMGNAAMAVVVQELVNPIWAGVLFSSTDVKGRVDLDIVSIEGVRGFGERLVSGRSSPEVRAELLKDGSLRTLQYELDLRRGRYLEEKRELPKHALEKLARGAAILEQAHARNRLDIEWAWDGAQMWFLQVRPIAFAARS